MLTINKIMKVKKNLSVFYAIVFLCFFSSPNCTAKITPKEVCEIVKNSMETEANLEYLSTYKELILTTLNELFDQKTGRFLFNKYKEELQQFKASIKDNYSTIDSIATIPVGPETLQAKYVLYNIISHKIFLGLTLAFIAPLFSELFEKCDLKLIISEHDITKLNYLEDYQQLHYLLISDSKTAKELIDTNPNSVVYRAANEHKRLSAHHPEYWWEVKRTRNIPPKYLGEMFADHLSIDLQRDGAEKTIAQKIESYKEYLLKYKFNEGKEWYGKYTLMKKLFQYAEKLKIKYRRNIQNFGSLIGLTDSIIYST